MTDVYHNVLCVRRAAPSRYSSADETGNEPLRSSARSQGSDLELKRRGTTTLHEPCPNTSTFQLCRRKTERQHAGGKLKQQERCDKAPPQHLPLRRTKNGWMTHIRATSVRFHQRRHSEKRQVRVLPMCEPQKWCIFAYSLQLQHRTSTDTSQKWAGAGQSPRAEREMAGRASGPDFIVKRLLAS